MLARGSKAQPEDQVLPEQAIKDPFVLEFLDLKDEYRRKRQRMKLLPRTRSIACQTRLWQPSTVPPCPMRNSSQQRENVNERRYA